MSKPTSVLVATIHDLRHVAILALIFGVLLGLLIGWGLWS